MPLEKISPTKGRATLNDETASLVQVLDVDSLARLQASATQAAQLLRTLANPDRLLLLCLIAAGEACVSDLASSSGIEQPSLSQQLGVLRDEGLVNTRREGKFVYYRVASAPALAVMQVLHRLYCPETQN